jgi:undecaprenyl-diphosphatase
MTAEAVWGNPLEGNHWKEQPTDELIAIIILGVIEGVTEFLPISSTGHLIVASEALGLDSLGSTYEIVIQLGAVLAVAWFYRSDLVSRASNLRRQQGDRGFWLRLVVAALPAMTVGYLFSDTITEVLFSPDIVAAALIVGGIVLWLVDRYVPERSAEHATSSIDAMSVRQALLVGLVQVAALIPGTSRSASSIVGGLLGGLDRPTATAFSFYLALPTLGGATLYALVKDFGMLLATGSLPVLLVGIIVAFVTALIAVRWLLAYVAGHDFRWFALYRVVLGVVVLILMGP